MASASLRLLSTGVQSSTFSGRFLLLTRLRPLLLSTSSSSFSTLVSPKRHSSACIPENNVRHEAQTYERRLLSADALHSLYLSAVIRRCQHQYAFKEQQQEEDEDDGPSKANSEEAADSLKFTQDERQKGAFDNYNISQRTVRKLKNRGINFLFPVQYESYKDIMSGQDCIVQARTGTGKTLAFSLPMVETLQAESEGIRLPMGRAPRCLVLEPTRELAKQITSDFASLRSELSLVTIYGGKQYEQQESGIRQGCDILIATPGRLKEFLHTGKVSLAMCRHVVLDEVDRILDMGFKDDVDNILSFCFRPRQPKPQMIVFSATMPPWVREATRRYMSDNLKYFNLIRDSEQQTATNVEHLAVQANSFYDRSGLVEALFRKYSTSKDGRAIVFCETKRECDQLGMSREMQAATCDVLHGDITQMKREHVLRRFRQGQFRLLITTDVSSRGLDIPEVDLVIVTSPPKDLEAYIHRSGRTGRAGKKGKCIILYSQGQGQALDAVEQRASIKFTHVEAPPTNSNPNQQQQNFNPAQDFGGQQHRPSYPPPPSFSSSSSYGGGQRQNSYSPRPSGFSSNSSRSGGFQQQQNLMWS